MRKTSLLACVAGAALLAACSQEAPEDGAANEADAADVVETADVSGDADVNEDAAAAPEADATAGPIEDDAAETRVAGAIFIDGDYDTPFGIPPFDEIQFEDYEPAFRAGMEQIRAEITDIANNPEPATFENTLEAMERAGAILGRVQDVFFNLAGSDTNEDLQALQAEITPELSRLGDELYLNDALFQRVRTVYEARDTLDLTPEQNRLLERYYLDFERAGATLSDTDKERLSELNAELATLTTQFGQNHLANTTGFNVIITDEAQLAGLPQGLIDSGAAAAERLELENSWAFGLNRSAFEGVMTFADDRSVREQMWRGYVSRGNAESENSNEQIILDIARLRAERAELMGYPDHASYILADRMAQSPDRVYELLNRIWEPAIARAQREIADMQAIIDAEGGDFELQAWDWWYYAERVREERYDFDGEAVRPYFELNAVRQAAFDLGGRLFGIQFTPLPDAPVYNETVTAYEVTDRDGSHLGVYLFDPFARPSKRDGAWMNTFRDSYELDESVRPIVVNVFNLNQPAEGEPALLSFDEAETVFHEFGHAVHGLVTQTRYERLSGTSVARDFVEFPSQMLENWAFEPSMMENYARHVETGEVIPRELMERINAAANHNQGFQTVEYLAASLLDMSWHTMSAEEAAAVMDARQFEVDAMNEIGLIPEIEPRYRSPYFAHIFAGGYSAGYYGYIWAEVLTADAYAAFEEAGDPFDPELAARIRDTIYASGGTVPEMELYVAFRGREPEVEPLMVSRGLVEDVAE